jgi:hypothetical protein
VILLVLSFNSTSAIYNITNGGGETLTALSIVGHFYFFWKRKFLLSAIFIVCGIYFKLHPIVFAFPFFIFSACSKTHRSYIVYLFSTAIFMSIFSYFLEGWKYGSLYPFSMIFSMSIDSSTGNTYFPIGSPEVFHPLALLNKIIYGFDSVRQVSSFYITPTTKKIASLFTIFLFLGNIIAGFVLSRLENHWENNDQLRLLHLFLFQVIVGFLFLMFSMDISIDHLNLALVSIYAPIFLFSATIHRPNDFNGHKTVCIAGYILGITLVGGLLPLRFILPILPLEWLDKISGLHNVPYAGFIWYQIPLLGIFIIAYVSYSYSRYLLKNNSPKSF